ncbi:iron uptake porin, partial [Synechococcus sp. CS-1331]|uniref:iron uptake porin n=1 Tax=Synechococcus sp. CS-1331 TaxID=2847973 RepID=UPI0021E23575
MTLSKKLLLALAGSGLVAPMAASANELASLGGNAAINEYMQQQDVDRFRAWESKNQVTSVNQFSDVQPTDWAYQALSNLVEKYGCVAGYPNGTYKGGQAMTRFEAAALLNACLDRVTEVTDELQRLMDEFKAELATLRGRVDGLEKKVGKLEAQQFSTTTKLYAFRGRDAPQHECKPDHSPLSDQRLFLARSSSLRDRSAVTASPHRG